jgi:hypothetical protein
MRIRDGAAARQTEGAHGQAQLVSGPVRVQSENRMNIVRGLPDRDQGDCEDWKVIE